MTTLSRPVPARPASSVADTPATRGHTDADVINADFEVAFRHRLRFTSDVLGDDEQVLLNCLHPPDAQVRVLTMLDGGVAAGSPGLVDRIDGFFSRHADRINPCGGVMTVAGGEDLKNDPTAVVRLQQAMLDHDLDRRSYVLVIGGGAVLDAVGYAAATAHRGIRLIRLPTTTLAQDDSGVGVKNAINRFDKKNWCGSFAVPWAVINDAKLLDTLPDRDYRCGFSEAVKVALLKDADFFARIERDAERIRTRDAAAALPVIKESALWHLRHITEGGDPFEMLEARPLDFGHWSAHRLEAMTNFAVRHGEAVATGLGIDVLYSVEKFGLDAEDADRIVRTLHRLGIKLDHQGLDDVDELFNGLEEFRQHLGGRLTVTMLRAPGDPIDVHEIDGPAMRRAIVALRERARELETSEPHPA